MAMRFIKQLSYLALIATCLTLHANINNLKGTFDVLKDEYKECSIINGAIADQTGYIMRLYDYGTLGQMRKESEQSAVLVPDISNAPEVVKLVHLFFHRTPGTISRGDFVFTQELRTASDEEKLNVIKAIAWMMAQIKKAEGVISKSPKLGPAFSQSINAINLKSINLKDEFAHLAYLANVESSSSIRDILKQQPEALKLFKLIWQSEQLEQGSIAQKASNIKPIFPLYTTNTVLTAIVYKLADNNKSLIKAFYEKLNEIITSTKKGEPASSIFINDKTLDQNWLDEHFNPADKQMLGEQLTFDADNAEQLKQQYESIVYLALLGGEYPQRAGFTTTYYYYDPADQTKKVYFVDCMDNTYRNLFNILFYDKETISFVLNKITGIHPTTSLINFYESNEGASDTEKFVLHNQWTNVIENIQFVAYNRKVGNESSADELHKNGYVTVPDGTDLGTDYIPVGKNDVVYEIQPSARNITIVFNHLLGLDLFTNEPGNTSDEKIVHALRRPDFIKTYFPLLCEKLDIRFDGFYLASNGKRIDETIDTEDYNQAGTLIIIKLKIRNNAPDTDVQLTLNRGHGELEVKEQITTQNLVLEWFVSNEEAIISSANNLFNSYFFSLPYLAVYKESIKIDEILNKIDPVHCFNLLFYLPINHADYVNHLIDNLNETNIQLNEYSIYLLFYLGNNIPDNIRKQLAQLGMYVAIIRYPQWNPHRGLTGMKNSSAHDLINVASEAIKSKDKSIQYSGSNLFQALFEKGQGYSEAIKVASETTKSKDESIQYSGLNLFKALVIKGKGYPEAIQAASDALKSKDKDIHDPAFELFISIFYHLSDIPSEKLTPELEKTINYAIESGKAVDTSTWQGQDILRMAQELEKKTEQK